MVNQLGIEYNIYEYRGQSKKKILEFRAAPGNIETGIKVIREKLGIIENGSQGAIKERPEIRRLILPQMYSGIPDIEILKAHVKQHTKNIIEGKVNQRR